MEKIKSKEELKGILKKYRSILNIDKIEYLDSLIELEFSALRNYISDDEKKILSDLSIYRDIIIYNIYNRAYDILSCYTDISKVGNKENNEFLKAYLCGMPIYEFNYKTLKVYEQEKMGSIVLFNSLLDDTIKEKEIERVINKIDRLKSESNPFSFKSSGLQATNWAFTHKKEIEKYERLLDEYSLDKKLTDKEKANLKIVNEVNSRLLDDYDIEFDKSDEIIDMTRSLMHKEYIKKLPNFNVRKNIKYI